MATHDTIVIGGSAGALDPLVELFSGLPRRFPAALLIVIHTAAENSGHLPDILSRAGALPVERARDGQTIHHGRAYVALPGYHLLVGDGKMSLTRGPRENGFRPAIDPLFYSAARSLKSRVIGVLLSGGLDDGTYGLTIVKEQGGVAIVQNPDDAVINGMPLSAIKNVEVDHIVRAKELPGLLVDLVAQPVQLTERSNMATQESKIAREQLHSWGADAPPLQGSPSIFTCPECGGSLWEIEEGKLTRFRCHVGHAYNMESLIAEHDGKLESALWTAARVMQERAVLRRHLADRMGKQGMTTIADDYRKTAADADAKSAIIRQLLESLPSEKAPAPERSSPGRKRTKKRHKSA